MRLQSPKIIEVKGRTIGGPAPLICLPLVAPNKKELGHQTQELMRLDPDLLEWRIDAFDQLEAVDDCLQALQAVRTATASVPLIFTCRIDREGGIHKITQQNRLDLITASMRSGMLDIVDIELCNEASFIQTVLDAAHAHDVKVMLSYHDFEKTPEKDVILDRLVRAQESGAHIAKVAVTPKNYDDVLVLLDATLRARTESLQIPMVTISMGPEGLVSRLAGGLFGSDITFAIGKSASAPGQIPIKELRAAMAVLYPQPAL
jgi:3-dehydroquinate dehydratase-1